MLNLILLIVAAVCFGLSALKWTPLRIELVSLGLLAWVLTVLLPKIS